MDKCLSTTYFAGFGSYAVKVHSQVIVTVSSTILKLALSTIVSWSVKTTHVKPDDENLINLSFLRLTYKTSLFVFVEN